MNLSERRLLPEKIAENIKMMIVNKELLPGDKLPNEIEFSKELGVSRTTIREAIKILVVVNALEIRRGKGTFVSTNPGISDDPLGLVFVKDKKKLVMDLFETRLIIEPELVALVCERATDEEIKIIESLGKEVEELILSGKNHLDIDREFHKAIANASHNDVVKKIIPIINESIEFGYSATKNNMVINNAVVAAHRNIIKAIKLRDKDKARVAAKNHIEIAINEISEI